MCDYSRRDAFDSPVPLPIDGAAGPSEALGPTAVACGGPAEAAPRRPVRHPAANQLAAVHLSKTYRKGQATVPVLKGLSLSVRRGEFLAIVGQSGSGKSTLLHLLGTLDAPDGGAVHLDGERIDNLPGWKRDALRNKQFGMIFQMYHLLPELTALENVMAPLMIRQSVWQFLRHRRDHRAAATELLETVGLGHRLKHKPRELSGGEMQRAAIARALVAGPQILLADEPTGNLDRSSGEGILEILGSLNRKRNLTIVMVTHDQAIAERADRVVRLVDGRIEDE
jgi:lipoprotein-releasing system ATP-binding protein